MPKALISYMIFPELLEIPTDIKRELDKDSLDISHLRPDWKNAQIRDSNISLAARIRSEICPHHICEVTHDGSDWGKLDQPYEFNNFVSVRTDTAGLAALKKMTGIVSIQVNDLNVWIVRDAPKVPRLT